MSFFQALHDLVFPPGIGPAVPIPRIKISDQHLLEMAAARGIYELRVKCRNCGFVAVMEVPCTCLVMDDDLVVTQEGGVSHFPDCPRCATASLRKFERPGPDILQEEPFGCIFRRKS